MDNIGPTIAEPKIEWQDLPIGVYIVAPDGHFVACNRPVRTMLGLPSQGPVQASLADYYADPKRRVELLIKAIAAEESGTFLEREKIKMRVNGQELVVEDYCKPLRDSRTHEITGYVGCLVDITEEHAAAQREGVLNTKVAELAFDIGRILHANTSTLLMAQQTMDGVAEALSQHDLKDIIARPMEELDAELCENADALASTLDRFLQSMDNERRLRALPESQWQALESKVMPLRQTRTLVPDLEMRVPALRSAAHQIISVVQAAAPGTLPRESLRDVLRAATRVESAACLIDVLMSRLAIIQMDSTLRSLRDFITADIRTHEETKCLSARALVDQAVAHMAEYANSSHVDIVRRDRDYNGFVEVVERDMVRALSNLLHNAIKYSWRRDKSKSPWVTIRVYGREGMACFEFENWGVAISQEEIENGLVFQLGYRGKWSKDRGRLGTGIGLTDAQRTAFAHHGDVRITSRPANPGWVRQDSAEYYTQPFITSVTLCLPQVGKTGRSECQ